MAEHFPKAERSQPPPVSATPPPIPTEGGGGVELLDPLVGKVLLDRVRIVRPIARGGMGKVYLAEQTRLKRRCAVKVLDRRLAGVDSAEFARRFLLEASVAAKITHPHVVTIFDYGETPEGCFIAMEYLEGRSLAEEMGRGPLAPARAVHIAAQVARALREAHVLGVVHRDVKPGNIFLLRRDDDDDFVKVLDFGLVHDRLHDRPSADSQGAAYAIMGSPRFMAPEQVQGKEVDARADIYALGVVMYAMLTGHVPFERRTELATMMAHVSDPPPPMASVAPGLVLPPGVEEFVLRCLAKNPDERWSSMEEMAAVLEPRATTSMPQVSRPPSMAPRLAPPSLVSLQTTPPKPPNGAARIVGTAALFAAVAALLLVALRDRRSAPVPAVSAVAAAPPPEPPPAPPPTASAAKRTASLHVETEPSGAKVTEEGETLCAATPCDIVFTGDAADPATDHLLAFLRPGYKLERKIARATASPLKVKLVKSEH